MPLQPFINLFREWSDNTGLDLKTLCMKSITLLSLCAMLRPSDIAPISRKVFSRDWVKVMDDGQLEIYLHGIKNDYKLDGFRVIIQPTSEAVLCPIATLTFYLARTAIHAKACSSSSSPPVFLSLKPPFTALSARDISKVLTAVITESGLDMSQFTPKNFRPTCLVIWIE